MKIDSVQYCCYAPAYKGSFCKGGSFKELERSLMGSDKDTFEHIISSIENAKDDNNWWFDTKTIHNGAVKIATMGLIERDGTPRRPGLFLVEAEKSLAIFKNLARWYKNNIEGYKE